MTTTKLSLITRDTVAVIGIEGYPRAISDGSALELNSPPHKYRQQKRWKEVPAETLRRFVREVEENTVLMLSPVPCARANLACYLYDNLTVIQEKYVDYFQERYPGCQFWASPDDKTKAIAVKHNDILVGLIMPIGIGAL